MHSRYRADSEYVLPVEVDGKGAEFIGNKFTHSLTHSHTQLYVSTEVTDIAIFE